MRPTLSKRTVDTSGVKWGFVWAITNPFGSQAEATSATSLLLSCRSRPCYNSPEATHSLRKAGTMTCIVHSSSNCNCVSWLPCNQYIKSDISSAPHPPSPYRQDPPPPFHRPTLLAFFCEPGTPCVSAPVLCKLGQRAEGGRVSINILPPFQGCYCSHELILSNNSSAERYGLFMVPEKQS